MPVVIVANKKDKLEQIKASSSRYVDIQVARDKASKEGLLCIETSAKTGENVMRLFTILAQSLADPQSLRSSHKTIDLLDKNPNKSKCSC